MSIIKRDTSRTQVDAEIIPFPNPLKHRTVPCPVRPGGGLWQHGEQVRALIAFTASDAMFFSALIIFASVRGADEHHESGFP